MNTPNLILTTVNRGPKMVSSVESSNNTNIGSQVSIGGDIPPQVLAIPTVPSSVGEVVGAGVNACQGLLPIHPISVNGGDSYVITTQPSSLSNNRTVIGTMGLISPMVTSSSSINSLVRNDSNVISVDSFVKLIPSSTASSTITTTLGISSSIIQSNPSSSSLVDSQNTSASILMTSAGGRAAMTSPTLTCSYCMRTFKERGRYETHLRFHTGETPYTCKLCNKQFRTKRNCDLHMGRHSGSLNYKCHLCPRSYEAPKALERHLNSHKNNRNVAFKVATSGEEHSLNELNPTTKIEVISAPNCTNLSSIAPSPPSVNTTSTSTFVKLSVDELTQYGQQIITPINSTHNTLLSENILNAPIAVPSTSSTTSMPLFPQIPSLPDTTPNLTSQTQMFTNKNNSQTHLNVVSNSSNTSTNNSILTSDFISSLQPVMPNQPHDANPVPVNSCPPKIHSEAPLLMSNASHLTPINHIQQHGTIEFPDLFDMPTSQASSSISNVGIIPPILGENPSFLFCGASPVVNTAESTSTTSFLAPTSALPGSILGSAPLPLLQPLSACEMPMDESYNQLTTLAATPGATLGFGGSTTSMISSPPPCLTVARKSSALSALTSSSVLGGHTVLSSVNGGYTTTSIPECSSPPPLLSPQTSRHSTVAQQQHVNHQQHGEDTDAMDNELMGKLLLTGEIPVSGIQESVPPSTLNIASLGSSVGASSSSLVDEAQESLLIQQKISSSSIAKSTPITHTQMMTVDTRKGRRGVKLPNTLTHGFDLDDRLCLLCRPVLSFTSDIALIAHMASSKHFGMHITMTMCGVCGMQLLKKNYRRHVRLHIGPIQCPFCVSPDNDKVFKEIKVLAKHVSEHHPSLESVKFPCFHCPERFTSEEILNAHFESVHSLMGGSGGANGQSCVLMSPFICSPCGLRFQTLLDYKNHHTAFHSDVQQQPVNSYSALTMDNSTEKSSSDNGQTTDVPDIPPNECYFCDNVYSDVMNKRLHVLHCSKGDTPKQRLDMNGIRIYLSKGGLPVTEVMPASTLTSMLPSVPAQLLPSALAPVLPFAQALSTSIPPIQSSINNVAASVPTPTLPSVDSKIQSFLDTFSASLGFDLDDDDEIDGAGVGGSSDRGGFTLLPLEAEVTDDTNSSQVIIKDIATSSSKHITRVKKNAVKSSMITATKSKQQSIFNTQISTQHDSISSISAFTYRNKMFRRLSRYPKSQQSQSHHGYVCKLCNNNHTSVGTSKMSRKINVNKNGIVQFSSRRSYIIHQLSVHAKKVFTPQNHGSNIIQDAIQTSRCRVCLLQFKSVITHFSKRNVKAKQSSKRIHVGKCLNLKREVDRTNNPFKMTMLQKLSKLGVDKCTAQRGRYARKHKTCVSSIKKRVLRQYGVYVFKCKLCFSAVRKRKSSSSCYIRNEKCLFVHALIHHRANRWQCLSCQALFKQKVELKHHMNVAHDITCSSRKCSIFSKVALSKCKPRLLRGRIEASIVENDDDDLERQKAKLIASVTKKFSTDSTDSLHSGNNSDHSSTGVSTNSSSKRVSSSKRRLKMRSNSRDSLTLCVSSTSCSGAAAAAGLTMPIVAEELNVQEESSAVEPTADPHAEEECHEGSALVNGDDMPAFCDDNEGSFDTSTFDENKKDVTVERDDKQSLLLSESTKDAFDLLMEEDIDSNSAEEQSTESLVRNEIPIQIDSVVEKREAKIDLQDGVKLNDPPLKVVESAFEKLEKDVIIEKEEAEKDIHISSPLTPINKPLEIVIPPTVQGTKFKPSNEEISEKLTNNNNNVVMNQKLSKLDQIEEVMKNLNTPPELPDVLDFDSIEKRLGRKRAPKAKKSCMNAASKNTIGSAISKCVVNTNISSSKENSDLVALAQLVVSGNDREDKHEDSDSKSKDNIKSPSNDKDIKLENKIESDQIPTSEIFYPTPGQEQQYETERESPHASSKNVILLRRKKKAFVEENRKSPPSCQQKHQTIVIKNHNSQMIVAKKSAEPIESPLPSQPIKKQNVKSVSIQSCIKRLVNVKKKVDQQNNLNSEESSNSSDSSSEDENDSVSHASHGNNNNCIKVLPKTGIFSVLNNKKHTPLSAKVEEEKVLEKIEEMAVKKHEVLGPQDDLKVASVAFPLVSSGKSRRRKRLNLQKRRRRRENNTFCMTNRQNRTSVGDSKQDVGIPCSATGGVGKIGTFVRKVKNYEIVEKEDVNVVDARISAKHIINSEQRSLRGSSGVTSQKQVTNDIVNTCQGTMDFDVKCNEDKEELADTSLKIENDITTEETHEENSGPSIESPDKKLLQPKKMNLRSPAERRRSIRMTSPSMLWDEGDEQNPTRDDYSADQHDQHEQVPCSNDPKKEIKPEEDIAERTKELTDDTNISDNKKTFDGVEFASVSSSTISQENIQSFEFENSNPIGKIVHVSVQEEPPVIIDEPPPFKSCDLNEGGTVPCDDEKECHKGVTLDHSENDPNRIVLEEKLEIFNGKLDEIVKLLTLALNTTQNTADEKLEKLRALYKLNKGHLDSAERMKVVFTSLADSKVTRHNKKIIMRFKSRLNKTESTKARQFDKRKLICNESRSIDVAPCRLEDTDTFEIENDCLIDRGSFKFTLKRKRLESQCSAEITDDRMELPSTVKDFENTVDASSFADVNQDEISEPFNSKNMSLSRDIEVDNQKTISTKLMSETASNECSETKEKCIVAKCDELPVIVNSVSSSATSIDSSKIETSDLKDMEPDEFPDNDVTSPIKNVVEEVPKSSVPVIPKLKIRFGVSQNAETAVKPLQSSCIEHSTVVQLQSSNSLKLKIVKKCTPAPVDTPVPVRHPSPTPLSQPSLAKRFTVRSKFRVEKSVILELEDYHTLAYSTYMEGDDDNNELNDESNVKTCCLDEEDYEDVELIDSDGV